MGTPTTEVTIPMGSSAGRNNILESRSATQSKIPPNKALFRIKNRLSLPLISRNKCGTINPTKLMTPTNAVATATIITLMSRIFHFRLLIFTPKNCASSSPIINAFKCFAYRREIKIVPTVEIPTIKTEVQLAPLNVPKFQKTMERACGSRAM